MRTLTATNLRSNLFKTLKSVTRGSRVRVLSKWGTVVLAGERDSTAGTPGRQADLLKPKAPGKIIGSLDDADRALRNHIRVPR